MGLSAVTTLGAKVSADELTDTATTATNVTETQVSTQAEATAPAQTSAPVETTVEPASTVTEQAAQTASTVDDVTDPSQYGATNMPYTRYEADAGTLENGAVVEDKPEQNDTVDFSSERKYVSLPTDGAQVSVTVQEPANAMTMRYTVPDGQTGNVDILVNGQVVKNVDLSSESAWQYVAGNHSYNSYDAAVAGVEEEENELRKKAEENQVVFTPMSPEIKAVKTRFRFDETHFLLDGVTLQKGDVVTIVRRRGDVGLDFIEMEQADAPIEQPADSWNLKDFLKPEYGDDYASALEDALYQASVSDTKRTVYIPQGDYNFGRKVYISYANVKIVGAGIWHTNLHFINDAKMGGGFEFNQAASQVEISNFFMDSALKDRMHEDAQYKAFSGAAGKDSSIHDIWEQHFEVGIWMGDYYQEDGMTYTDGLSVFNARLRNNLADGANLAQGTKFSTIRNSNIRGNGDDGLASWSSKNFGFEPNTESNTFKDNTIELGWRAGGIGFFGGNGNEAYGNLVQDQYLGSGIRVNTTFPGNNFDGNDKGINIHDNYLLNTGTSHDIYGNEKAAIDLYKDANGALNNINVYNNRLINSNVGEIATPANNEGVNVYDNTRLKDVQINKGTAPSAEPVVEQPAEEPTPAAEPVVEQPAEDTASAVEPVVEQPTEGSAPAVDPVVEQPTEDSTPAIEPVVEQPTEDTAPAVEPVVEQPTEDTTPTAEPVVDQPAEESTPSAEPAVEQPAEDTTPSVDPVVEQPTEDTVPVAEPAVEQPAEDSTPAAEPAVEPVVEQPSEDSTPSAEPVAEQPTEEPTPSAEPVVEQPAEDTAPAVEPVAEQPAEDTAPAVDPVVEQPAEDSTPSVEPVVEQPTEDTAPVAEPVVDQPAEEPTPAVEPGKDQAETTNPITSPDASEPANEPVVDPAPAEQPEQEAVTETTPAPVQDEVVPEPVTPATDAIDASAATIDALSAESTPNAEATQSSENQTESTTDQTVASSDDAQEEVTKIENPFGSNQPVSPSEVVKDQTAGSVVESDENTASEVKHIEKVERQELKNQRLSHRIFWTSLSVVAALFLAGSGFYFTRR